MKKEAMADNAAAPAFGKFQTSEELLNAYNNLEAEFTKKSQRLKELEGEKSELSAKLQAQIKAAQSQLNDEDLIADRVAKNHRLSKRIFEGLLAQKLEQNVPVLNAGIGRSALTPVNRPKSLAEAKKLVDVLMS